MSAHPIRITKRYSFELAHALYAHDGGCAQVHGHSYVLEVTLLGIPRVEQGHPKNGMVMDFADLKAIVNKEVVHRYDHALLLSEQHRETIGTLGSPFGKVLFVPWQPTCENMVLDIVARIGTQLPAGVSLLAVRLHETATSYAEWNVHDAIR
ncbi:MAG: 6-carboxytetrahydropterin synthase [Flavobacteriales bacterium]|nr:6-carboxytetrahydropterin synthase [Flavobacteriales bacterium]